MSKRERWLFAVLPALLFLGGSRLFGQAPYSVPARGAGFYYGHVSLSDHRGDGRDAFILRSGEARRDAAILNMPIVPGDGITVPPGRRLEIQFDNGTIVRLDGDSEMAVETVMARALSAEAHLTTLILRRGRIYIMYKQYHPTEIFQVATPESAVKLRHNCVAVIGVSGSAGTDVRVRAGRVDLLLGQRAEARLKKPVRQGGRAVVDRVGRFVPSVPEADGAFEAWNETINREFIALHMDMSQLPAPVRRASEAVQAFARKFSRGQGRWLRDYYGASVWQPALLAGAGGSDWAPYQKGCWTKVGNEMFWVGGEDWGWAPYHLGLWHWDAKLGWLWVPGSVFAGAWTDWAGFGEFFGWQGSWLWGSRDFDPVPREWIYRWQLFHPIEWTNLFRCLWKGWYLDMLEVYRLWAPSAGTPVPGFHARLSPGLLEGKALREGLLAALRAGDPSVQRSLFFPPSAGRIAARKSLFDLDLASKSAPLTEFAQSYKSWNGGAGEWPDLTGHPLTAAEAAVGAARAISDSGEASSKGAEISGTSLSVRDWNPDADYLASHGASVRYLAGSNQIICPELGMTSAKAAAGFRFVEASSSEFRTVQSDGGVSLSAGSSSRLAGKVQQPIQNPGVTSMLAVAPPARSGKEEAVTQAAKAGTAVIK